MAKDDLSLLVGLLPNIYRRPHLSLSFTKLDKYSVPEDLIGAKVVRVAAVDGGRLIENGDLGLVIEYIPEGRAQITHLVLGFNELGMWVESHGEGGVVQ